MDVSGLAIICLGHLARIHRRLDLDRVSPLLKELRRDKEIGDRVGCALDDIQIFMGVNLRKEWKRSNNTRKHGKAD